MRIHPSTPRGSGAGDEDHDVAPLTAATGATVTATATGTGNGNGEAPAPTRGAKAKGGYAQVPLQMQRGVSVGESPMSEEGGGGGGGRASRGQSSSSTSSGLLGSRTPVMRPDASVRTGAGAGAAASGGWGGLDAAQEDADDVIYVFVVRGKRTALAMCAVTWVGSLSSMAVIGSAGVPSGSAFLLATNLTTFLTCFVFLIPPFLSRWERATNQQRHRGRALVLAVVWYNAMLALAEFAAAAVASNAVQECRLLTEKGSCAKMQGAIAVAFIVSMAMGGSFLVSFVGSVVPRDITVTTYLRGLGNSATTRLGGSASFRGGSANAPAGPFASPRRASSSGASGDPLGPGLGGGVGGVGGEWNGSNSDHSGTVRAVPLFQAVPGSMRVSTVSPPFAPRADVAPSSSDVVASSTDHNHDADAPSAPAPRKSVDVMQII